MYFQFALMLLIIFGGCLFLWKKVFIPFLYDKEDEPETIAAKKEALNNFSKKSMDLDNEIKVTAKLSTVKSDVKSKQTTLNELDEKLKE